MVIESSERSGAQVLPIRGARRRMVIRMGHNATLSRPAFPDRFMRSYGHSDRLVSLQPCAHLLLCAVAALALPACAPADRVSRLHAATDATPSQNVADGTRTELAILESTDIHSN